MIPLMLAGRDVIGQAQTGTGKTAAFALPILHNLDPDLRHVQAMVMAPTRELAMQVARSFYNYGEHLGVKVLAIYGGSSYTRQISRLRSGVNVVVGTPGRMLDLIKRNELKLHSVSTVVLDEADEMLSMGFIDDIEAILQETPDHRQTSLFSATMPKEIRKLANNYLNDPEHITIERKQLTVAAIEQRYHLVNERDKIAAITRIFEVEDITRALIFARTRVGTGELANELTVRGFASEPLNGDLTQDARIRVLNRFREGKIKVLVATDVAARGLDIDDISHVFNHDLPPDPEIFVHRVGRTGRAGKTGIAISLITPQERGRLRRIENFTRQKLTQAPLPTEEEIKALREESLMTQMAVWINRGRCKREQELVAKLVEDGHDPMMIAAIALKMARAEEKQRPIAHVGEVNERPERGGRNDRSDRRGGGRNRNSRSGGRSDNRDRGGRSDRNDNRDSRPRYDRGQNGQEQGMVKLTMSFGKDDGIRPNDVVGTLAYQADIPGRVIGKINILDGHTLVDVPTEFVDQVLAKKDTFRFKRNNITIERA
jgi:ATP-dependent RNA helicase DeaD